MRGVGVLGSLLAGLAAAHLLSGASPASAETATASLAAVDGDDYYTRRARRLLEAEKAKAAKPHPLAASYPGMDIVVCEAGCADRAGANVVFMRERIAATEQREAIMVPTSAAASFDGDAASPAGVACIAGCYGATARAARPLVAPRVERMHLPPRDRLSPIR